MRYLFIFLICCGCSVTSDLKDVPTGEWKQVSSLMDIGDGKGTWSAVTENITVNFNDNGSLGGNDQLLMNGATYKFITDSIQITRNGEVNTYRFERIHADSFIVRPRCIEACGLLYARQK